MTHRGWYTIKQDSNCSLLYHTNHIAWMRLCYGVGSFCLLQSQGFAYQVKGKSDQTSYHSILQHHVILSEMWLVAQGILLMQDNDPKHTN